jgi:hypothetical protein
MPPLIRICEQVEFTRQPGMPCMRVGLLVVEPGIPGLIGTIVDGFAGYARSRAVQYPLR